MTAPNIPPTPRSNGVRRLHGLSVPDPYDWLAVEDARTCAWQDAQQEATDAFLARTGDAAVVKSWLQRFLAPARVYHAVDAGQRRFFLLDRADCQGVALAWRDLSGGPIQMLDAVDDGEVLLQFAVFPSPDGAYVAIGVKPPHGDVAGFRVIDVAANVRLADALPATVQPAVAWTPDSRAFYYNQNQLPLVPERQRAPRPDGLYLHRLGEPSDADRLVMGMIWSEAIIVFSSISGDGRTLYVNLTKLVADVSALYALPLRDGVPDGEPELLCPTGAAAFSFIGSADGHDYFLTDLDAPQGRLIAFDSAPTAARRMREIVPESKLPLAFSARDPLAERAAILGDRLYLTRLHDAAHAIEVYDLEGRKLGRVTLPPASSVAGSGGDRYGALRASTQTGQLLTPVWRFTDAPNLYIYDPKSDALNLAEPALAAPAVQGVKATREFVERPDGARIPLTVLEPADAAENAPCLLYGYGAAGMPITPEFGLDIAAWLSLGGRYVVAHVRGGGEYGAPWRDAAGGPRRQVAFDDFIASAEYLRKRGFAVGGLAIRGLSAGGLLVSACLNQRPDLFDAVIAELPFVDPLSIGADSWSAMLAPDLGNPHEDPEAFRCILAYSPLQNVRADRSYPPTFVVLADGDAPLLRSGPRQFAAALQNAGAIALLHTVKQAGHGGWSTAQLIDTASREIAFLLRTMHIELPPAFAAGKEAQ